MITENELRAEYERLMREPEKIVDPQALSTVELTTLLGVQIAQANRRAREKVEAGEWERVWKYNGNRLIPAYRPKRERS